jgi:hypothetical protein
MRWSTGAAAGSCVALLENQLLATIARLPRKGGTVYKAIVKRAGRVVKTKTFDRKADAKECYRK